MLFIVSVFVSASGIALFGGAEHGHYFVYHPSRIGAAGMIEVTREKYLLCEVANWTAVALILGYIILGIRLRTLAAKAE